MDDLARRLKAMQQDGPAAHHDTLKEAIRRIEERQRVSEKHRGVATLANPAMMPDGKLYSHVHAEWLVFANRQSELRVGIGYDTDGNEVVVIPTGQMTAVVLCNEPPSIPSCYKA